MAAMRVPVVTGEGVIGISEYPCSSVRACLTGLAPRCATPTFGEDH